MSSDLITDLKSFLSTFLPDDDLMVCPDGIFNYNPTTNFNYFNKDIIHPRDDRIIEDIIHRFADETPEEFVERLNYRKFLLDNGMLIIRSDDDFWREASLPYRFAELSTKDVVEAIWPSITNPVIQGDTSDIEYWDAYYKSFKRVK